MSDFGLSVTEISEGTLLVDIENIDLSENEDSDYPSISIDFDVYDPFGYPKELHPPYSFNFRHYKKWKNINDIDRYFPKSGGTIVIPISPQRPDIIKFACDLMSDIAYGDEHDCNYPPMGGNQYYNSYSNFPYPLKFSEGKGRCLRYEVEKNKLIHWGVIWPKENKVSLDKKTLDQRFYSFKWNRQQLKSNLRDIFDSSQYQHFPLDGHDFQVLPIDEHDGFIISFGLKVGYGAVIIVPDSVDLSDLLYNLGSVDFNRGWDKVQNINKKFYQNPTENVFQFLPLKLDALSTEISEFSVHHSEPEIAREILKSSIEMLSFDKDKCRFDLTINNVPVKRVTAKRLLRFLVLYTAYKNDLSVVFSTNDELAIKFQDLGDTLFDTQVFKNGDKQIPNIHSELARIIGAFIPDKEPLGNYLERDEDNHYPPHERNHYLSCVRLQNIECKMSGNISAKDLKSMFPEWTNDIDFIFATISAQ